MRILLIIPPTLDNKPNRLNNGKHVKRGLLPPLGVGYIAAVLLQDGHEVSIVDSQVLGYNLDEVLYKISIYKPDILGISFLTPQKDNAYELIIRVKADFKGLPIIVGGAHPTCFPSETMEECKGIDILVTGEGEYVMLDIINCLQGGMPLGEIKGIYYRNNTSRIMKTCENDQPIDLEMLPFPARHLYPIFSYLPEPFENKRSPSTNIIVSRGCAYAQCTFCYRSGILKRKYRIQSVEKTLDEIKHLVKNFGIKEFIFYDDDLGSNRGWLIKFCNLLKKEKLPVTWSFRARPNTVDNEILKQAKETGCFSVSFGFESGNQDLLDSIKKGITLEQSKRAADLANGLGLEVVGTFMLGLPGETPQKAEQTIKFAIDLDCTYAAFIPTHPFKGTALYEQCMKEGKIVLPAYSKDMCQTRYIPDVTYVPAGYRSKEEVEDKIKKAYRKFYLRPGYFLKHIKKLKRFEDIKRYWSGLAFLLDLA